ncbi:tetratricopeptide repeat protein [Hydrogenobacter sp. T-2]|uniref:SPOR domain-containing protein n=1 Tax=Pampinifervens diazotrophicum TaxID=1632018 RepID=UPI002B25DAE0|nr:tetratricopeptide repeat protein [Hydrogenobacter sp. T-2]WPM31860.1 tetratricopeptide repeat protein [Hydrogenobacter sp. T-2]
MRKFTFLILLFIFSCAPKQEDVSKSQWQYLYDLGMSSYIAKNYSEAIANFFRASQLAPNEPKVWNALGLAYMEVQEYQKSENAFLRALQVDKTYTEAKLNLGVLYYRQKDYERAIRVLREVIEDEAFPQKHMAFYSLAKVYQAMDRREDYLANLRRAVAYNPMFLDAQFELAQFYEEEGDYRTARDVYQRLISNGIVNPSIYLSIAKAEYKLGNYTSAKDYIRRVIEDRQVSGQLKSQAYELLSLVLIAEQNLQNAPRFQERPHPQSAQQAQPLQQQVPVGAPEANRDTQTKSKITEPTQQTGRFYRIQVGAFSSANSAKAWKDRLERELNLKDVVVVESAGVFKVLYGKFESREETIKELERLRALNLYGFIVYE